MFLKLSKYFTYASLFSVLIVMPSTFFPYIGGKYYFFRAAVELALVFLVLWWAFQARPGEFKTICKGFIKHPLFIATLIFTGAYLLASLFAVDPHGAFWSNYERGEGGFQMLHYFAFFVLLLLHVREEKSWKLVFRLMLAAAVFMILYGVLSVFGVRGFIGPTLNADPTSSLWDLFVVTRFQGSLGNPAYVAPYLMFSLFYALYLWAGSRAPKKLGTILLYGGLSIFFLTFFVLSNTRGAFLGLGAAIFAYALYMIYRSRTKRWVYAGALAAFIVLFGVLFAYRDAEFVRNLPGGRLFELSWENRTVQTRLWTWNSAWQAFKERPLLGWGPENFSTAFDKYFDPRHYIPNTNAETWFDRAHSVFFGYLADTGILGFLSYLSLFVVFFYLFVKAFILKRMHAVRDSLANHQQALIFALPIGYLVQGLALFDVLPIYINLFFFLAFSTYLFYNSRHESSH